MWSCHPVEFRASPVKSGSVFFQSYAQLEQCPPAGALLIGLHRGHARCAGASTFLRCWQACHFTGTGCGSGKGCVRYQCRLLHSSGVCTTCQPLRFSKSVSPVHRLGTQGKMDAVAR